MIYFKTPEGQSGALDIVQMLRADGLIPTGVQDGNVMYTSEDGVEEGMFSVADWAMQTGHTISKIDGFNSPVTALPLPPTGMNSLDQSVWFMDGGNMQALQEMFPQAQRLSDGRAVVLDKDGLWKTMWSDNWSPPAKFPTYQDLADRGQALDVKEGMKSAGIVFLFGLSGQDLDISKTGGATPKSITKCLRAVSNNAPTENKMMIGKIMHQTTGIDEWKFMNALYSPEEVGAWLDQTQKSSTFQFRMKQVSVADMVIKSMHQIAVRQFIDAMNALSKMPEAKHMIINLKEVTDEFITMLDRLDVIRDMGKITGLEEWKSIAEDKAVDPSKLPPMPAFVPKLVKLLKWIMPVSQNNVLAFAKGQRGFKAIMSLMVMVDNCLYSLSDVPDSTAKQKMFMALKNIQTRMENKLAIYFHPEKNPDGMKSNLFHEAKKNYGDKREVVYAIVQSSKETWAQLITETLRKEPNLEAFYDTLPKDFAGLLKTFLAMDVAYDMQPWIDPEYRKRINDPLAMMSDIYGAPPPEFGYLADNSPRAALNIIETLTQTAAMFNTMGDRQRLHVVRSPLLFANMMNMLQTAAVQREVGTVETLTRMGMMANNDPYTSVDPRRIWEDPVAVAEDQKAQMAAYMEQMASEKAAEDVAKLDQNAQSAMMAEQQGAPAAAAPAPQSANSAAPNGAPPMMAAGG